MQKTSTTPPATLGDHPHDDERTSNDDGPPATSGAREERVRNLAYTASERRGFAGGFEVEDWLEAEKQVDAEEQEGLSGKA